MIISQPVLGAARQFGWWALGRRRRFRITGPSMEPTLHDGEFVLVDPGQRPVPGQLALARHPGADGTLVVKRVAGVDEDGRYVLASDNPGVGTDSRQWGPLEADAVIARVTLVLDRPTAPLERRSPRPRRNRSLIRWLRR